MKILRQLISNLNILSLHGNADIPITSLAFDSRFVQKGSLFIAVQGTLSDGHTFIPAAIAAGASAIVCQHLPEKQEGTIVYIQIEDTQKALGHISAAFYDYPSDKVKLIGVTGTNGKTTCTTLLFQLFRSLGYRCGLLSTVQNQIQDEIIPSTHTTPDAVRLNELLAKMVKAECSHVFMEVSSHAIDQKRIEGLKFAGGVFTNITHDHLDYHKTFDEYLRVKKLFFDHLPKDSFALSNADDRRGTVMLQNTKAQKKTYSLKAMADFKAKVMESCFTGMLLQIDNRDVWFQMTGRFNAYNLLAVYATAVLLGEESQKVLTRLSSLHGAEGRFNCFTAPNKVVAIVDYAHTSDALENVLKTIADIKQPEEKVITVVGCGGNRDHAKRPVMAKIAFENSNKLILTSDNPRSEEPTVIIGQMAAGLSETQKKQTLLITDRREAIKAAYALAQPGDIILIAGKGHEKYQEINGIKHHFDDAEEIKALFQ